MRSLHAEVAARGGFATTRMLRALGARPQHLTAAVRSGELVRIRNGHYTTRSESDPAVQAIRVGGKLTGISALAAEGAWMWHPPTAVHVAVARTASRLRTRSDRRMRLVPGLDAGLRVHWEPRPVLRRGSTSAVDVRDALLRVALDEDLETTVISIDWALRAGRLDLVDLEELFSALPARLRPIRELVSRGSQAITETAVRLRFVLLGYRVAIQVSVDGLESAIDVVVEDLAAIELDGREFHEISFERDRRKDARITIGGRHALRVTWHMVRDEWPLVLAAVESVLRAHGVARPARRHPMAEYAAAFTNSGTKAVRGRFRPQSGRIPPFVPEFLEVGELRKGGAS